MRSQASRWAILLFCLALSLGVYCSTVFNGGPAREPYGRMAETPGARGARGSPAASPSALFDQRKARFVGAGGCVECHEKRVHEFEDSRHHLTSRLPTDESTMGDFLPGRNVMKTRRPEFWYELEKKDGAYLFSSVERRGPSLDRRTERVGYVIGSGKIATVMAYWQGDRLFQLPAGHFTELGTLTNCPGFPDGYTAFDKPIVARCMDCHATYLAFKKGSINRYEKESAILGVGCERCHGPGSEHVAYHRRNPGEQTGRCIVAPLSLSRTQRIQMCAQCHGDPGKLIRSPFGYLPGDPLESYVIQQEASTTLESSFIHTANQALRLSRSRCYTQTDRLECVTCHDPHRREEPAQIRSNKICLECHTPAGCGMRDRIPAALQGACIDCHMPARTAIDTPVHTRTEDYRQLIRMTEHRIGVHPLAAQEVLARWLGAQDDPACRTRAGTVRAELQQALLARARRQAEQRKYLAAIDTCRTILDLVPEAADAKACLEKAMAAQRVADRARAHNDYGMKLLHEGKVQEAQKHFLAALALDPALVDAHVNLGLVAAQSGNDSAAAGHFKAALACDPESFSASFNWGIACLRKGDFAQAAGHFAKILERNPNHPDAQCNLGVALMEAGKGKEAVPHFRACLDRMPDHPQALRCLAWILATDPGKEVRDGKEALELANRLAKVVRPPDAQALETLAAAQAECGSFKDASRIQAQAVRRARSEKRMDLVPGMEARLATYKARAEGPAGNGGPE